MSHILVFASFYSQSALKLECWRRALTNWSCSFILFIIWNTKSFQGSTWQCIFRWNCDMSCWIRSVLHTLLDFCVCYTFVHLKWGILIFVCVCHRCVLVTFGCVISFVLLVLIQSISTRPLHHRQGMSRPSSVSMIVLWRWPQWSRVWRWRWSYYVWQGWRTNFRLMSGPPLRSFAMQALRSRRTDGFIFYSGNKSQRSFTVILTTRQTMFF